MSTDLTIGYIVHDGTYAVVEDRTFVARCSNRQQAERVRAALSAADELARAGWALLSALTEGPAWAERAALEAVLDGYRDATNPNATLQDAFVPASPTTADGGSKESNGE